MNATSATNTMSIQSISELLNQYDAFLIDIWGVVHDGAEPYPGVVECLNNIISNTGSKNKMIIFMSNAPRPGPFLMKKLQEFGIKLSTEMILSSGDLVRYQLTHLEDPLFKKLGRCFYHLGASRNLDIVSNLSVQIQVTESLKEANYILLTAFIDEGEAFDQFDPILKEALSLKLPAVCANPDKEIINLGKPRYCAGVIAERYEKMGGTAYYYGKPYPGIFEFALRRLSEHGIKDKKRILMIGDTLETDILGANTAGMDSAIVLTGNMGLALAREDQSKSFKSNIQLIFDNAGIKPTWIIPSLSF